CKGSRLACMAFFTVSLIRISMNLFTQFPRFSFSFQPQTDKQTKNIGSQASQKYGQVIIRRRNQVKEVMPFGQISQSLSPNQNK
ncbi:MAG TPA: hypothetical protein PLQ82_00345, partial [Desulfobacteraceae bacterium]|nr:hypothetical protein [Desulfobacteraceae bacterium]